MKKVIVILIAFLMCASTTQVSAQQQATTDPARRTATTMRPIKADRAVVNIQTEAVLQVSPNPATDAATITIAYEGVPMQADCYLTDVAGKVLWQKQIQIIDKVTLETLIINELPKGLYVMRVQIGSTFLIQKIVKG